MTSIKKKNCANIEQNYHGRQKVLLDSVRLRNIKTERKVYMKMVFESI